MAQLEYASLTNLSLADADDPHAYRLAPSAWRFAWLWWNLAILTALAIVIAAASMGKGGVAEVLEQCKTDFLMYAPLTVTLSILVARGKIDLSFPLQQILALMIFGAMVTEPDPFSNAAPTNPTAIVLAVLVAIAAAMVLGLVNWLICSVLRAPSAVATMLMGAIVLCIAVAIVPDLGRFSGRMGSSIGSDVATTILWIALALSLLLSGVVTVWLLVGRSLAKPDRNRRELGAELIAFLMVSIASALMGVMVIAAPSVQGYGVALGIHILGMPQLAITVLIGVLIGGTVLDGKVPNPVGALLGAALTVTAAHLAEQWLGTEDMYTNIFIRAVVAHVPLAGSTLVILCYGRRVVTILRAMHHPQQSLESPSRGAWAMACLSLIPWILSPLTRIYPDHLGLTGHGPEASSRLLLGMAFLAGSLTYIVLVLADALLCKQLQRARRNVPHLSLDPA